jgi:hypothetical protein
MRPVCCQVLKLFVVLGNTLQSEPAWRIDATASLIRDCHASRKYYGPVRMWQRIATRFRRANDLRTSQTGPLDQDVLLFGVAILILGWLLWGLPPIPPLVAVDEGMIEYAASTSRSARYQRDLHR